MDIKKATDITSWVSEYVKDGLSVEDALEQVKQEQNVSEEELNFWHLAFNQFAGN